MREKYLQVLGLENDADDTAIEQAYYKLLSQYGLEEKESGLKKINEINDAYNYLVQNAGNMSITMKIPSDPHAFLLFEEIEEYRAAGDYENAVKIAELAVKRFGELESFLYLWANCLYEVEKLGKAIKVYENLVEKYPEKPRYLGELAIAYKERGFTRKALASFEKAYADGLRDLGILSYYANLQYERGEVEDCIRITREVLTIGLKNPVKNAEHILGSYLDLAGIDPPAGEGFYGGLLAYTSVVRTLIETYEELYEQFFSYNLLQANIKTLQDRKDALRLLTLIQEHLKNKVMQSRWMELTQNAVLAILQTDQRIFPEILGLIGAKLARLDDEINRRYVELDFTLLALETWRQSQFEMIKTDYPAYYSYVRELAELPADEKQQRSYKEKLLKEHFFLYQAYFRDSQYYDRYPDQKPNANIRAWDSLDSGSFKRTEKRIGRNEPCPCGSGRKYKRCCGKN